MGLSRRHASRSAICERTPSEFAAGGSVIHLDGARVFYIETGRPDSASPVVFLHGIPTSSWIWRNVIPAMPENRRSIALDLPGFGLSSLDADRPFTIATITALTEQAINQLLGSESRPVLVAHDFGGLVASELITRSPDRYPKVVFTNTSLRPTAWIGSGWRIDLLTPLRIPWMGQLSMILARPWMLRLAASQFLIDPADPDWFAGYWYPFERGFGQSLARFYQSRPVSVADFDRWRAGLPGYNGQSLLVWGRRDPAFGMSDFSDIRQLLGGPEVLVLDNASHFLMEDQPGALGRRISAFLTTTD